MVSNDPRIFSFPPATVAASQSVNISVCINRYCLLRKTRSAAPGDNTNEKQQKPDRPRVSRYRHSETFGVSTRRKKVAAKRTREVINCCNAKPAAARFPCGKCNPEGVRGTATWNTPGNACNYYGRGRRYAFVPADERSRQTRCAARWQISHRR